MIANKAILKEKNEIVLKKIAFFDLILKRDSAFLPWKRNENPYKKPIVRPITNDKSAKYETMNSHKIIFF